MIQLIQIIYCRLYLSLTESIILILTLLQMDLLQVTVGQIGRYVRCKLLNLDPWLSERHPLATETTNPEVPEVIAA
jgi:hypothetical protein